MASRPLYALWLLACALTARAHVIDVKSPRDPDAIPRMVCRPDQAALKTCQETLDRETYLIDGLERRIEYDMWSFGMTCDAAPLGDVRWPRFPKLMHPEGVELTNCPPPANSSFAEVLRAMNISLDALSIFVLYNMPAGTKVESSAFDGLSAASTVYLQGDNGVWKLPGGALDKFPKATWMFLDNVFVDRLAPRVNTVDISSSKSSNVVKKLPEGFLMAATNMLKFQANSNNYREVPADLFRYSPAITEIDLSFNKISNLPTGFFEKATKLTDLNLSHNRLKVDAWAAMGSLVSLVFLSLRGNPLHKLPSASSVRSLKQLQILDLGKTQQHHADFEAFHELTNLQKLNMESNHISGISCRDLVFLHKKGSLRQTVDLRDNPLYEVTCSENLFHSTLELIPHTKGVNILVDTELRCACGASWTERLIARMQRRFNKVVAPALDRESCRDDAGSDCE